MRYARGEGLSTGRQTEQGRAERKDLEVGAVDELLVGECEVERVRQGTKTLRCLFPLAFLSPLFIIDQ